MRMKDKITLLMEALFPKFNITRRSFLQGAAATAGAAALPQERPEVRAMREIHGMVDAYNNAGSAAEYIASAHGRGIVHSTLQNVVGALTPEQHATNLQHLQHLAGHLDTFKRVFPDLARHPALLHLTPHATDARGVIDAFGDSFNAQDPAGQWRMAERAEGFLQNPGWRQLNHQIMDNPELSRHYMDISRNYLNARGNVLNAQWRAQDAARAAERQRAIENGEIDPNAADEHFERHLRDRLGYDDEYDNDYVRPRQNTPGYRLQQRDLTAGTKVRQVGKRLHRDIIKRY